MSLQFYLKQLLLAFDQLINALLFGWADETISSRSYRLSSGSVLWRLVSKFIDVLFFFDPDHCRTSYEAERLRSHLPPEYRTAHAD